MSHRKSATTKRRGALAALAIAVSGCAASTATPPSSQVANGGDPVEAAIEGLGTAVTGCAASASATTLTLTLGTDTAVISAPNGRLAVNGNLCSSVIMSVTAPMTTTNTTKIVVTGNTAAADKVILDLLPGSFGSNILSTKGGITVDFSGDSTHTDALMIRGSASVETFKFGTSTTTSDIYIDLSGDKTADVKVTPGTSTPAVALTASMGGGADIVIANPVAADMTGFAGTANIVVKALTTDLTAYGGIGKDTFTGGIGNDTFYGGDDDDTFKMGILSDGADVYQGDNGNDTVDYSNRTTPVKVDIGPATPTLFGTVDLSTLAASGGSAVYGSGGTLDAATIDLTYDGTDLAGTPTALTVTLGTGVLAPMGPQDVVTQINTACGAFCKARLTGQSKLAISTASALTVTGSGIAVVGAGTANTILGLPGSATTVSTITDADDGVIQDLVSTPMIAANENDDVRSTTENILGGGGADVLVGDASKNLIKGGAGNDIIEGGANTTCAAATDGDSLQGEANDDTILVPQKNCWAVLAGGAGTDTADYSGRTEALDISNDMVATDGYTAGMEKGNIGTDIETLVGGFGNDNLTGGMNADTLIGGAGNDVLAGGAGDDTMTGGLGNDTFSGGAGFDTVDYTAAATDVTATLCVSTATAIATINTDCGAANDGESTETDQIANVEHLKGSLTAKNTFTAAQGVALLTTGTGVGVTFEGGSDIDTFTGNDGADFLFGNANDDVLSGGAGDDMIDGGLGDDTIDGGAGQGDVCVSDSMDVTTAAVKCELN